MRILWTEKLKVQDNLIKPTTKERQLAKLEQHRYDL